MPKRGHRSRQLQAPRAFDDQFFKGFWMLREMLASSEAFEVAESVVERVSIDVVNVVSGRNRPVSILPDIAV
jgi:hypothetical protein